MAIDLTSLAAQLTALSSDDAATLLDAISGLTERAQKAREERARAEAERDAWAPRLVCGCGEPATVCRYVRWEQADIRLGIQTWRSTGPKGGFIATHSDCGDSPSNDVDVEQVEGDLWVSCSKEECVWVRIPGGHDGIVGWE